VSNVVQSIPEQLRALFVEILAERDANLLAGLQTEAEPTPEQREAVDDIFSSEIVWCGLSSIRASRPASRVSR
jgi:hypothetical protein